jgi:polyadenylate-binding protein
MWSQRDPSIRKSGQGNIFISKLDESIDNKALYDTFSTFGNILSCKVVTNEKGESKGYGFVHYETQEAAEQAIEKVNGMLLNGKLVHVLPFKSRSQRHPETTPNQFTNVYVKHFPKNWSDDDLKVEFSVYGEIQSVVIQKDEEDKSRGFGFVNFHKHESAVSAIDKLHLKKTINGEERPLYVQRAMRRNEREIHLKKLRDERAQRYQGINLYVKNLDDSIDDNKLREEFVQFGKITSAVTMRDDKGNSRGFGFVCFTSPDEASKAVTNMHNQMLAGKPLYVALAERIEIRRAKLAAQYAARAAMRMTNANMSGGQMYSPVFYPPQNIRAGMVAYPVRGRLPSWNNPGAVRTVAYNRTGNYGVASMGGRGSPSSNVLNSGSGQQGVGSGVGQSGNNPSGGNRNNNNSVNTGNGNPQRAFKYNNNARNQPVQSGPGGVPVGRKNFEPVNQQLLYGSGHSNRQILGESLYPKIRATEPSLAPKITGMLLESLEPPHLLALLENPEALKEKINEAITVLREHQDKVGAVGAEEHKDDMSNSGS